MYMLFYSYPFFFIIYKMFIMLPLIYFVDTTNDHPCIFTAFYTSHITCMPHFGLKQSYFS